MRLEAHKARLWVFVNKPWNPMLKNLIEFIRGRILGWIHTNLSFEKSLVTIFFSNTNNTLLYLCCNLKISHISSM
jgi:hypothetical protein